MFMHRLFSTQLKMQTKSLIRREYIDIFMGLIFLGSPYTIVVNECMILDTFDEFICLQQNCLFQASLLIRILRNFKQKSDMVM